jgi:hypothetical protein
MMNDRFSAQLRQHLLDAANERPADGQLASVMAGIAATPQRRPLAAKLPGFQGRIGPFPAVVRYGLIAALLALAAVAGAILAGAGAKGLSTPFEGTWTAIDVPDGSTMNLIVGAGGHPSVRFEDLHATGDACVNDEVKVFTADGVGEITGSRLEATFPNGGGCGLETTSVAGTYDYDPATGTLTDQNGIVWSRVRGGDNPLPTLVSEPSSSPSPTRGIVFEGRWTATDPADESTLTLVVGAGTAPVVQFQDDLASGASCVADAVKIFRADGVGEISGNRLVATYPDGGGCGLQLVAIAGRYDYEAATDTLTDQDGVVWTRVPEGAEPAPTLRPAPTRMPGPTLGGGCVDLTEGGTYTASVGPLSFTAIVPGGPVVPWHGARDVFSLAGTCTDGSPMALFASTETSTFYSTCMPGTDVTTFAEAIARLDTPRGADISPRIDLSIDGHPAARWDIVDLDTCPGGFGLWHMTSLGGGETGSIYVIDVDGTLVEIELNRDGSQTPADLEEAYAIIAGLQITR